MTRAPQDSSASEPFQQLAEELGAIARLFGDRGWTPATSSNFSVRLGSDHCAVTISGRDKTRLTAADLMVVDLDGNPDGNYGDARPSAEAGLHLALYRRDPAIGAVLHTHAPNSVLTTRLQPKAERIQLAGYELLKAFAGITTHDTTVDIPVIANRQAIDELAREADRRLDGTQGVCWAYLIRDHGVYAWGADLAATLRHLEALDYLLGIELELARLGGQTYWTRQGGQA
ncbi:MAG: methylthioribulose 1-phosphate dehydratase [Gammaproteobacteria bacterium]|nr:MAG: methylthioribulose 1-phosphate dehydratase [Gammaproteobacteria bacterium]